MKTDYALITTLVASLVMDEGIDELENDGYLFGKLKQTSKRCREEIEREMSSRVKVAFEAKEDVAQELVEGFHKLAKHLSDMHPADANQKIKSFIESEMTVEVCLKKK